MQRLTCAAIAAALLVTSCAPKKPAVAPTGPQFPDFVYPAPLATSPANQVSVQ